MVWIKWLGFAGVVGGCMALCLFFWPFEPVLLRFGLDGHLERLIIGFSIGLSGILSVQAVLLARARARKRLRHEEELRRRRQSKLGKDDSAAWTKKQDDLSRVFDRLEVLPTMPHIFRKLKAYWGYPEFLDFADDLLTMEQGREGRQGFDPRVHKEVTELRQFYLKNIDRVMAPELTEVQKNRIRQRARKFSAAG